jgi:hypothetical protein
MKTQTVFMLTIQGDTEQVFIGRSEEDACRMAQEWIESEQLVGYLGIGIRKPRITKWHTGFDTFYYNFITAEEPNKVQESWDNYSVKMIDLVYGYDLIP